MLASTSLAYAKNRLLCDRLTPTLIVTPAKSGTAGNVAQEPGIENSLSLSQEFDVQKGTNSLTPVLRAVLNGIILCADPQPYIPVWHAGSNSRHSIHLIKLPKDDRSPTSYQVCFTGSRCL